MARVPRSPEDAPAGERPLTASVPAATISEPAGVPAVASRPRQDRHAEWDDHLPDIGGGGPERQAFPRVPPAHPFVLVFTPNRWDVVEGQLIPVLYRLSLAAGHNGITKVGRGRVQTASALGEVEERGDIVLPWEIGGVRYIRGWVIGLAEDRKTGATVKLYSWHTAWERLWPDSDQITSDTAGYARWVRSLVETGVLPHPRGYVVDNLLRKYETALYKRMEKDGNEVMVDEYKRRIGVLNVEINRQLSTREPIEPDPTADPGELVS